MSFSHTAGIQTWNKQACICAVFLLSLHNSIKQQSQQWKKKTDQRNQPKGKRKPRVGQEELNFKMNKIERKIRRGREKISRSRQGSKFTKKKMLWPGHIKKMLFFHLIDSEILKVHTLLYTNKHTTATLVRILLLTLEINLYIRCLT